MTPHPQRCVHYDACWFVHQHSRCPDDEPTEYEKSLPDCRFDTRTNTPAAPAAPEYYSHCHNEEWCRTCKTFTFCELCSHVLHRHSRFYPSEDTVREEAAQAASKAERERAAKRVDAFADSLHDLESIVIKGGLRELAESLRGGGAP